MTTAEAFGGMNLFDAARAAGITFRAEVLPQDRYAGERHTPALP